MSWDLLINFFALFIIIFIIDYFFINRRKLKIITNKGKRKKKKSIGELDYLIVKFELNPKKINKSQAIIWISLINSFIISFVSNVIMNFKISDIWPMLVAFVLLFCLIYSLYEIYGRYLKKQQTKND